MEAILNPLSSFLVDLDSNTTAEDLPEGQLQLVFAVASLQTQQLVHLSSCKKDSYRHLLFACNKQIVAVGFVTKLCILKYSMTQ